MWCHKIDTGEKIEQCYLNEWEKQFVMFLLAKSSDFHDSLSQGVETNRNNIDVERDWNKPRNLYLKYILVTEQKKCWIFVSLQRCSFGKIKMITYTKAKIIFRITAYHNFKCCEKRRLFKGLFVNVCRGIVFFYKGLFCLAGTV